MDNPLEMIVWDVQHGNATYMRTPNGTNVLFDIGAGSYSSGGTFSPIRYLKNEWSFKNVDCLVISHPHTDHISDIKNMVEEGLKPRVLSRPSKLDPDFVRASNQGGGELIDIYLEWDRNYNLPVSEDPTLPTNNGGVIVGGFLQRVEGTANLNNYSLVMIVEYADQKIILPGDIETVGWKALLEGKGKGFGYNNFIEAIAGTTILVAAHHGRESGFCEDIFDCFSGLPDITIVSDGKYTETDVTGKYRSRTKGTKVKNRNTEEEKTRKVLTTRSDGVIYIAIGSDGSRTITIG